MGHWMTHADPLSDLRRDYAETRAAFGPGHEPPFPILNPFTGETQIVPLRVWIRFAEWLLGREMAEGVSRRGLFVRWRRWAAENGYRMAGTDVS